MIKDQKEAVARLQSPAQISYDELEDIFLLFGFRADFEAPNTTWYRHKRFDCGEFYANPRYAYSVLSDAQRHIVRRMIQRALDLEELKGA